MFLIAGTYRYDHNTLTWQGKLAFQTGGQITVVFMLLLAPSFWEQLGLMLPFTWPRVYICKL